MSASKPDTFKGSFDEDVPAAMQDDVLTRIVEAAWAESDEGDLSIIDKHEINALNIEFTGSITIDGREHFFHIRDGNNNGTEILSWNQEAEIVHETPEPIVLVPSSNQIANVCGEISARDMLEEWDRARADDNALGIRLSNLPQAYAYDRHFAPGSGAASSHRAKANEFGYDLAPESDAVAARLKLIPHLWAIRLDGNYNRSNPLAALIHLDNARDADTNIGRSVKAISDRAFDEAAKSGPWDRLSQEHLTSMGEYGLTLSSPQEAVMERYQLLMQLYEYEDMSDFDASTLPDNPIAELFQRLDPSLVKSTKVNPDEEARRYIAHLCGKAARAHQWPDHEYMGERLAEFGKVLIVHKFEEPIEENEFQP